jgi:hypothetical protein
MQSVGDLQMREHFQREIDAGNIGRDWTRTIYEIAAINDIISRPLQVKEYRDRPQTQN